MVNVCINKFGLECATDANPTGNRRGNYAEKMENQIYLFIFIAIYKVYVI